MGISGIDLDSPSLDPRQFRRLCGRFASGVTIMNVVDSAGVPHGDHEILIGKVLHANWRDGEPLVHFGSRYRALESSPNWWSTI
jgi:flavin reductase (DIM6/NTAB) family NADH-FMN oxidoreductase RutF